MCFVRLKTGEPKAHLFFRGTHKFKDKGRSALRVFSRTMMCHFGSSRRPRDFSLHSIYAIEPSHHTLNLNLCESCMLKPPGVSTKSFFSLHNTVIGTLEGRSGLARLLQRPRVER